MRTPGKELRDPTLAFHTLTTSLLNSEDAVLCLVRKTIHLSPLYLFLPYSVVRPIRINNLALGQLERHLRSSVYIWAGVGRVPHHGLISADGP